MPSRLSSLLVRDGLVGVKRMEKAFQRQVIYGGSLDTILLEMNLIPEERLTQYLALASGLPPASRDEGARIDDEAVSQLSAEISQQFRAVPLSLDGEALRVLVCSRLVIDELEDLADLLDRPLQPLITPEYRWFLAYSAAYKEDPPARFTTLARALDVEIAPTPVGRARSVIIEGPASPFGDAAGRAPGPAVEDKRDITQPLVVETPQAPQTRPPDVERGGLSPTRGADPLVVPITVDEPTIKTAVVVDESRQRQDTLVGIVPPSRVDTTPGLLPTRAPAGRNDGVPEDSIKPPSVTFSPSTGVPHAVSSPIAGVVRADRRPCNPSRVGVRRQHRSRRLAATARLPSCARASCLPPPRIATRCS